MKYILLILISGLLLACRSNKIAQENPKESILWTKTDFKPSKDLVMPNAYTSYFLNVDLFKEQLQAGEVNLPMPDGSMSKHKVEDSQTMSAELQLKYPQIRSYRGYDLNQSVCQSRIDQKNETIKCVVYCNDATIYIQELHDLGLYFVFLKNDLPQGVGTVNE